MLLSYRGRRSGREFVIPSATSRRTTASSPELRPSVDQHPRPPSRRAPHRPQATPRHRHGLHQPRSRPPTSSASSPPATAPRPHAACCSDSPATATAPTGRFTSSRTHAVIQFHIDQPTEHSPSQHDRFRRQAAAKAGGRSRQPARLNAGCSLPDAGFSLVAGGELGRGLALRRPVDLKQQPGAVRIEP